MSLDFQRTLRIPDDGKEYFLPPGLGKFPVRHLDDFADRVPSSWLKRGGVLTPMYQAEALWINFSTMYPFAVKIASGKLNALTGEGWRPGLTRRPQDYLVVPGQRWLDGFTVEKGIIRQFVAMPLGTGYSVEEQLTGNADFGGIQIQVFPMKASILFRDTVVPRLRKALAGILIKGGPEPMAVANWGEGDLVFGAPPEEGMGLAMGGRMRQEIYQDENAPDVWDIEQSSRCFVHLCNSRVWREITGTNPPHPPITAKEYERFRLPWFDFYRDDIPALEGSDKLAKVKSVATVSKSKGDGAFLDNDSVQTPGPIHCGPKRRPNKVREWRDDSGSVNE